MTRHSFSNRFRRNLALGLLLPSLLVACDAPDNSTAADEFAVADDASDDLATETYVIDEDEAQDGDTVVVVEVPVAAATSTETAPLSDAAAISRLIAAGDGIERVRNGDGWAWRQDGRIIRTASNDGQKVAYFTGGSDTPFLIQQDDRAYAFSNGSVTRRYDRNGKVQTANPQDREAVTQLVREARDNRGQAERVASSSAPSRTNPAVARTGTPSATGGGQRQTDSRSPARPETTAAPTGRQPVVQQSGSRPSGDAGPTRDGDRGRDRPGPNSSPTPDRRSAPDAREHAPG
jgi:hypothetical protein